MKVKLVAIFLGVSCLLWQLDATAGWKDLLGKFASAVVGGVGAGFTAKALAWFDKEDDKKVQKPQEPQSTGYHFSLTWTSHDGTYSGDLLMQGTAGEFRVNAPLERDVIVQNMVAQPHNGDVLLIGSNPHYSGTSSPLDYYPDSFLITNTPHGWTITDTCDDQEVCSPVTVISASTF